MEKQIGKARVELVPDDITLMEVDAFVFYARPELKLGTGWGNAIAVRAGPSIQDQLDRQAPAEVGQVVVTDAGKLKAKHILHAVGPAFQELDLEGKLRRTVRAVYAEADKLGITSLALPAMGSGFYGVPPELAARACLEELKAHLQNGSKLARVYFCVPDPRDREPFTRHLQKA